MKKTLLIFIILLCASFLSSAQEDTLIKSVASKTWITLNNNPRKVIGELYDTKDSAVLVMGYFEGTNPLIEIDYKNIITIKARKKNSVLKGALFGTLLGAVIGGIAGVSSDNTFFTPGTRAFLGAIGGVKYGAIAGSLAGAVRVNIPINGNLEKFNSSKSKLKKYSYKH